MLVARSRVKDVLLLELLGAAIELLLFAFSGIAILKLAIEFAKHEVLDFAEHARLNVWNSMHIKNSRLGMFIKPLNL